MASSSFLYGGLFWAGGSAGADLAGAVGRGAASGWPQCWQSFALRGWIAAGAVEKVSLHVDNLGSQPCRIHAVPSNGESTDAAWLSTPTRTGSAGGVVCDGDLGTSTRRAGPLDDEFPVRSTQEPHQPLLSHPTRARPGSAPTRRMGAGMADKGSSDRGTSEEVTSLQGRLTSVRFYTVAEVASVMRVSKMSVYRLIHSGELEAVRFGRSFRVPESAVKAFLNDAYYETG